MLLVQRQEPRLLSFIHLAGPCPSLSQLASRYWYTLPRVDLYCLESTAQALQCIFSTDDATVLNFDVVWAIVN